MKRNQLKDRYTKALKQQFRVDKETLNELELEAYINDLKDNIAVIVTTDYGRLGGHAMLLVKENGKKFFYDPNESYNAAGFSSPKTTDCISREIMRYCEKLSYGELQASPVMQLGFERLDITRARTGKSERVTLYAHDFDGDARDVADFVQFGRISTVQQSGILKLVAAYFNTVYKPKYPISARGVCYGLTFILRELLVQTDSVQSAASMLYAGLNRLKVCSNKLQIQDERATLSEDVLRELQSNQLVISMISYFQSVQLIRMTDAGVAEKWLNSVETEASSLASYQSEDLFGLPLSIMMRTSIAGSEQECFMPSNPLVIFNLLSEMSKEEIYELYDGHVNDMRLKDEKQLLKQIKIHGIKVLTKASDSYRFNPQFMLEAIIASRGLGCMGADKDDQTIGLLLLESGVVLSDYKEFDLLRQEKTFIDQASLRGFAVKRLGSINSRRQIIELVKNKPKAFLLASKYLREDRSFLMELSQANVEVIRYFDQKFKKDRDLMLYFIKHNPKAIQYMDDDLRSKHMFVKHLVEIDPSYMQYADDNFKGDIEFILLLIRCRYCDLEILEYVSPAILHNPACMIQIVKINQEAARYIPECMLVENHHGVLLRLIAQDVDVLAHLNTNKKTLYPKEVVFSAIGIDKKAFYYASDELKQDMVFILEAMEINVEILEYVSEDILSNRANILELVSKNPEAIRYAQGELKQSWYLKLVAKAYFVYNRVYEVLRAFRVRIAMLYEAYELSESRPSHRASSMPSAQPVYGTVQGHQKPKYRVFFRR